MMAENLDVQSMVKLMVKRSLYSMERRGHATKSTLPGWNLLHKKAQFRCEFSYQNDLGTGYRMQKREEHWMIGARILKLWLMKLVLSGFLLSGFPGGAFCSCLYV